MKLQDHERKKALLDKMYQMNKIIIFTRNKSKSGCILKIFIQCDELEQFHNPGHLVD